MEKGLSLRKTLGNRGQTRLPPTKPGHNACFFGPMAFVLFLRLLIRTVL